MTLSSVIHRLETATGPSRELDAAIFCAIGLTDTQERHCREWCRMDGRTDLTRKHYLAAWAPDYTRSLDAALTLVDAQWELVLAKGRVRPDEPLYGAVIYPWGAVRNAAPGDAVCLGEGEHDVFAIALCLAALRARAQQQKE